MSMITGKGGRSSVAVTVTVIEPDGSECRRRLIIAVVNNASTQSVVDSRSRGSGLPGGEGNPLRTAATAVRRSSVKGRGRAYRACIRYCAGTCVACISCEGPPVFLCTATLRRGVSTRNPRTGALVMHARASRWLLNWGAPRYRK